MSRDSGTLKRGLAAVLSLLSVGSVAGAVPGKSKVRGTGGTNVSRQKMNARRTRKVTNQPKTVNSQVPSKDAKSVAPILEKEVKKETPNGVLAKVHSGIDKAWNGFSKLGTLGKIGVGFAVVEGGSILYNGRGFVENITKPVSGLLDMLRELIFDSAGNAVGNAGGMRDGYELQNAMERAIYDNWGPFFGIISKLAFYFKDSYIDVIRAFLAGLKGKIDIQLGNMKDDDGKVKLTAGDDLNKEFVQTSWFNYANFAKDGNWGKKQIKQFVTLITKGGWKMSSLNLWAYRLGELFSKKKEVQTGSPILNNNNNNNMVITTEPPIIDS